MRVQLCGAVRLQLNHRRRRLPDFLHLDFMSRNIIFIIECITSSTLLVRQIPSLSERRLQKSRDVFEGHLSRLNSPSLTSHLERCYTSCSKSAQQKNKDRNSLERIWNCVGGKGGFHNNYVGHIVALKTFASYEARICIPFGVSSSL